MRYYFDNNISPRYAAMLRALDVDVRAIREDFPANTLDIDFLQQLRDCILITADRRIRTRKLEAIALRRSGISALFLGSFWAKLTVWDGAKWMVAHWPEIDRFAMTNPSGTYAEMAHTPKYSKAAGYGRSS